MFQEFAGHAFVVTTFNCYRSGGGFELFRWLSPMPFFRLALRAQSRVVFFFDFVDFFLHDGLQGGIEELSSFVNDGGFGAIEELSSWCVFGEGFCVTIE